MKSVFRSNFSAAAQQALALDSINYEYPPEDLGVVSVCDCDCSGGP